LSDSLEDDSQVTIPLSKFDYPGSSSNQAQNDFPPPPPEL